MHARAVGWTCRCIAACVSHVFKTLLLLLRPYPTTLFSRLTCCGSVIWCALPRALMLQAGPIWQQVLNFAEHNHWSGAVPVVARTG